MVLFCFKLFFHLLISCCLRCASLKDVVCGLSIFCSRKVFLELRWSNRCLISYFGFSRLCQRDSSCSMFSNVWSVVLGCFLDFLVFLVLAGLSAVVWSCGKCFGWFYVLLDRLTVCLVICCTWWLVVSMFFIVVSNCSNRSMSEIGMVCSKLFYVVFRLVF